MYGSTTTTSTNYPDGVVIWVVRTTDFYGTETPTGFYAPSSMYFPAKEPAKEPAEERLPGAKTPPGTRPAVWFQPEFPRPPRARRGDVPVAVRWRLYARRNTRTTTVRPVAPVR